MSRIMKRLFASCLLALGWIACPTLARGEIVLNSLGTYTQNFDSLTTTSITNVFSATVGTITAVPNLNGEWDGSKIAGTGANATSLLASDGQANTGSIYSFGAIGSTERALGMIASGTNIMGIGFAVRNNTGILIDRIDIAFTQENWRSSTTATNTMVFGLGDATVANNSNYLTASGFDTNTALDLVGPPPVASNGALDGNLTANQVSRSATITTFKGSALVWNPGETLYFRWQDANEAGNDAGLAIDNFSLTAFSSVPEPSSMALAGIVLGAGTWFRYRRRRNAA
jgi:hypothetical protein